MCLSVSVGRDLRVSSRDLREAVRAIAHVHLVQAENVRTQLAHCSAYYRCGVAAVVADEASHVEGDKTELSHFSLESSRVLFSLARKVREDTIAMYETMDCMLCTVLQYCFSLSTAPSSDHFLFFPTVDPDA